MLPSFFPNTYTHTQTYTQTHIYTSHIQHHQFHSSINYCQLSGKYLDSETLTAEWLKLLTLVLMQPGPVLQVSQTQDPREMCLLVNTSHRFRGHPIKKLYISCTESYTDHFNVGKILYCKIHTTNPKVFFSLRPSAAYNQMWFLCGFFRFHV